MYPSLPRAGRASRFAKLTALVCLLVPTFAVEARTGSPRDAVDWSALALKDIDAMRTLLRDNTPIAYDKENPSYARWLEEGFTVARDRAARVTDQAGYLYTLNAYANGFHDPHFAVGVDLPAAVRWPGFVAAARGDTAIVVDRDAQDPSAPPLGARIESCDGQPLSALVHSRVLPFSVSPGLPDRWAVHNLFLDQQNPFAQLPATCAVRTGGKLIEMPLHWREISGVKKTFGEDLTATIYGSPATFGLSEPSPGVFWIGVPTFLTTEETAPQMREMIAAIKARGNELRNARAIIIDTRHNGGGYAFWARQLAEAIFTPKVLQSTGKAVSSRKVSYDQRVSSGNAEFKREKLQRLSTDLSSEQRRHSKAEIEKLDRAMKEHVPMVREGGKSSSTTGGLTALRPRDGKPPFPAKVYFLSNGSCVSSCLVFADQALMVPGVRLIGSATGGDTPYMDIREEELPSGLATLSLAQTVMRGRGRGALEAYSADIPYAGSWDDASVRAWTLSLVNPVQLSSR